MPATKEQLEAIANDLANTCGNVYDVAKNHGVEKWTDEDFVALEEQEAIFKCVECDEWKDTSEVAEGHTETCEDCCLEYLTD